MAEDVAPPLCAGRYRLVSILGSGGMATVYRAYDALLDVFRAVKVLDPELTSRRKTRERFLTEARTMARLRHDHIVGVFDIGVDAERVYMLMELVEGGSLIERVDRHGPLAPRVAAEVMVGVLSALERSHEMGVVHRDVKPHNVLLTLDGVAKVTDFGIAAVTHRERDLTRTGAVMGTWAYMAPEQRKSARDVDGRSDVYAAGATLYAILTGEEPLDLYVRETRDEMVESLPEALADIVCQACEYKADQRFASAAAMARALEEVAPLLAEAGPDDAPLVVPRTSDEPYIRPDVSDYDTSLASDFVDREAFEAALPNFATSLAPVPVQEPEQAPKAAPQKEPSRSTVDTVLAASVLVERVQGGICARRTTLGKLLRVTPRISHVVLSWRGDLYRVKAPATRFGPGPGGSTPMRRETVESFVLGVNLRRSRTAPGARAATWTMVLAGLTGTLMLVFTLQAPFGFLADPRFAIAATLGASVLTMGSLSLTGLGAVLAPLVMFGGGLSRNTLLFYDLDEEREGRFLALQRAAQELKSGGLWYVAGGLPERHAGNPVKTSIKKGMPARVRTNVEPVRLDIGGQRLFMLPDGLWVEHDRKIRVVGWPEIQARVIGATAGFDMIEFGESKASGLTADLLLAGGGVEVLLRAEAAEAVHGVAMAIEGLRLGRDGGWDNPY